MYFQPLGKKFFNNNSLFVDLHNLFIYLFSNFHLEETKKKALNEGLTKGLKVPARPAALRS